MKNYFQNLNYTMGDEDPSVEMALLPYKSNKIMAVADCGSRIIPLLAKQPAEVLCVDINNLQLAVCELRLALTRERNLHEFLGFLGYTDAMQPSERQSIFKALDISNPRKNVLNSFFDAHKWQPFLYAGKFEKMLKRMSTMAQCVLGDKAKAIFDTASLKEQKIYYRNHFPKKRLVVLLSILGNSTALNTLLYRGEFPKKNVLGSHLSNYQRIFDDLLGNQVARDSFFLQTILLGRIVHPDGWPPECKADTFSMAQAALKRCRITFINGDILNAAAQSAPDINFLSLSDVPSFQNDLIEQNFLTIVSKGMAENALVVVRSHLRRPNPKLSGFIDISKNYTEICSRESTRLWSFHIYQHTNVRLNHG